MANMKAFPVRLATPNVVRNANLKFTREETKISRATPFGDVFGFCV